MYAPRCHLRDNANVLFNHQELPPVKKTAPKAKKQYGGPGSFVSAADDSIDGHPLLSRELSTGTTRESLPPSLRSHASGQVDLYVPPYQSVRSHISTDSLATEFAELSVDHTVSRRQSLPVSDTLLAYRSFQ